jgi:hypothetical protein
MPLGNDGASVDGYIRDTGVAAATTLAQQILEPLAGLQPPDALLLNALIALARELNISGSEVAPTAKVQRMTRSRAPPQRGSPAVTVSPSSRMPRGAIMETSKSTVAGAGFPPGRDMPARTDAPTLTKVRYETCPSRNHSGNALSGKQPRNTPQPITGRSATTRSAGMNTTQPNFDDPANSINAAFEQSAEPLSPTRSNPPQLRNQHRIPTVAVGALEAEPAANASYAPEASYRGDDGRSQHIALPETRANYAGFGISTPSLRLGPQNTDTGEMAESRRAVPGLITEKASPSVQGTVYLDSAAFGHWVIDHLTREITRPTTGMTGFDPRITASYPGAPIGG